MSSHVKCVLSVCTTLHTFYACMEHVFSKVKQQEVSIRDIVCKSNNFSVVPILKCVLALMKCDYHQISPK